MAKSDDTRVLRTVSSTLTRPPSSERPVWEKALSMLALLLGVLAFGGLAYLFKDSGLAAIPLLGVAVFVVLWPLYEKLQTLRRFSAEFEPRKISIQASGKETELLELENEIRIIRKRSELKRAQLELEYESRDDATPPKGLRTRPDWRRPSLNPSEPPPAIETGERNPFDPIE